MSESVSLPALGESVTEGTVTRWLKNVGDRVEVDEPLLEVSTDKVDTEIPSPVAGVIEEILVQEDETVDVGTALVRIGDGSGSAPSGETTPEPEEEAQPAATAPEPVSEQPSAPAPSPQPEAPETSDPNADDSFGGSYSEPTLEQEVAPAPSEAPAEQAAPAQPAAPEQSTEVPSVDAPESAEAPAASAPVTPPAPAQPQSAPSEPAPDHQAVQPSETGTTEAPSAPADGTAPYVTPIVRKLAGERGVELSSITGTGVGGRIRKEDVLAAAEKSATPAAFAASAPAAPAKAAPTVSDLRGTTVKMTRLRKVVAERAVVSMQSTAQLTTVVEVDVTKVAQLRTKVKDRFLEKTGVKLSFLPFFAIAATEALKSYPIINATVEGDSIAYPDTENLSIAVDTERGLLTPVVRDAGSLDIAGLAAQIADLASRTRENKLKPDELAGGTFTLTNTGSRGALFDTPLVFLPQVAILGTGVVTKKPVVITADGSDSIAIRSTVYLALSYDHRIVDGADAARFLVQIKDRLETGDFEGDLGI
ncbi:2-oxoglutarate dehydrogenase, E2 component, dihydrolipoamide succinyltransferase [Amnibacterium flavum]|uniref:Dihydrolipoamide acetyltransferase component of pyruvate dehydrogenase complex n=1 Tax=Amnibacterium flavum TaxID=2173173 RepID=A0A2V1HNX0_9MICO|nr:2-oxoglutarate dehydrogenase, E2 component, dihydrolipoamide succinyltransferase [Amnibacterium flavum]PVZ94258.1 2-oxoglutarate dehydrogenase, E2 component, dihydrolipoamide succinyltransferase [Amnibacterium flavum]